MLIAQITDLHIAEPGTWLSEGIDTAGHLARAVAHINALEPRPDLLMITGDLVERRQESEYARLAELLAPLAVPFHLLVGNHDHRDRLRAAFPGHAHYLPAEGFIQYCLDDAGPLRLIALDTLIPGKGDGELCAERLDWLARRLEEQPDRPTVIFMHHPPFATGLAFMDESRVKRGADELARLIAAHGRIEHVLCGHLHRPITRRFAGTLASTVPATAHQMKLALDGNRQLAATMDPPAVALHWWPENGSGLVSHLSYVGEAPTQVLFDGENWVSERRPLPART